MKKLRELIRENFDNPVGISPTQFKADISSGTPANYQRLHRLAQEKLTGDVSHIGPEHLKAIHKWTSPSGYKAMNNRLKSGDASPFMSNKEADTHIKNLFHALRGHSIPNSTYAYRGTQRSTSAALNTARPGDTVESKGFASTTLDPQRATHFAKTKDIMAIKVPQGAKALYVSHPHLNNHTSEQELLLPHGSKYLYHGSEEMKVPEHHYSGSPTGKVNTYKIHHVSLINE